MRTATRSRMDAGRTSQRLRRRLAALGPGRSLWIVLALGACAPAWPQASTEVLAQGSAPIVGDDIPKALDRAVTDAKSNAIRQALTGTIGVQATHDQEPLLSAFARSASGACIGEHTVLRHWQAEGRLHVSIRATVTTQTLQERARRDITSDASIAVVLPEYIDGREQPEPLVQNDLIRRLSAEGFRVLTTDRLDSERARQLLASAARVEGDQLASLGVTFMSGILVTGRAEAKFSENNQGIISSHARVTVRAVLPDTGEILVAEDVREVVGFGVTAERAALRALSEAAPRAYRVVARGIADYLTKQERTVRIEVLGQLDEAARAALVHELETTPRVRDVAVLQPSAEKTSAVVTYGPKSLSLAARIAARLGYEVLDCSRDRVLLTAQ